MLSKQQITTLCELYSAGTIIAPLERVAGGLLHSMYLLRTERGRYAVKVVDNRIAAIPGIDDAFRASEEIAMWMATVGVPAVCALNGSKGILVTVDGAKILVFPWIEGSVLSTGPAGAESGRRIGEVLGHIHSLGIQEPDFEAGTRKECSESEWRELLALGKAGGLPWVDEIESLVPSLLKWEAGGIAAAKALGNRHVVSHGDLDQKNVLWSASGEPWIIDWESAGPVHPTLEVIAAALDWSGQSSGEPDDATFMALLSGYRSTMPLSAAECKSALVVRLADWIGWLLANLDRSIDADRPRESREIAEGEVSKTARTMRALSDNVDAWGAWCE